MTEDLNKRVIDLMTDLFNAAAEQSASADSIAAMVEEITRDTVADAVEDAVTDKIGYSEVITEDNFNDWLEDADVLNCLESIQYAIDELESDFVTADRVRDMIAETTVTLDVVNQMMRDLETDLEAAKLSNRVKVRVERLFTLTKAKLRSLASIRLSIRKG
jgi:hypothetical protein